MVGRYGVKGRARWLVDALVVVLLFCVALVLYQASTIRQRALTRNTEAAALIGRAVCNQSLVLITLSLEGKSEQAQQRMLSLAHAYIQPVDEAMKALRAGRCVLSTP